MPKYLLSMYQPDGDPPPPEILAPIMSDLDAVGDEMRAAGAWVFSGGLHPPSTATVLRAAPGDPAADVLVTDGPFAEGKEHLGGFTVVESPDLDAALAWGEKVARASGLPIEVRPFWGDDEGPREATDHGWDGTPTTGDPRADDRP